MKQRGRPRGAITTRRAQVLAFWAERIATGERPSLARIARECGLHSHADARRIVRDLVKLGRIPDAQLGAAR